MSPQNSNSKNKKPMNTLVNSPSRKQNHKPSSPFIPQSSRNQVFLKTKDNQNNFLSENKSFVTPQTETIQRKAENEVPVSLRNTIENSFNQDFSDVNIYKNSTSAQSLNARAYTQGNSIHFSPGEFNANTEKGRNLIGHEFTHVAQQRSGAVNDSTINKKGEKINSNSALEQEADTFGQKSVKGEKITKYSGKSTNSTDTVLQKKDEDTPQGDICTTQANCSYTLNSAKNDMLGNLIDTKQDYFQRHEDALGNFERTMKFAQSKPVGSIIMKGVFNQLIGKLPAPINDISATVILVADAYSQSASANKAVQLDQWIMNKRDALQKKKAEETIPDAEFIKNIDAKIKALTLRNDAKAKDEIKEWVISMQKTKIDIPTSVAEIETELYDEWCRSNGAYYVTNYYQKEDSDMSIRYSRPWLNEYDFYSIGTWGGNLQRYPSKIPKQILDRLKVMGQDPYKSLPKKDVFHNITVPRRGGRLPQYEKHHEYIK